MRALMDAMKRWLHDGTAPPPSRYPRLADGTLVPAARVAFPAIPGVQSPRTIEQHHRDGQLVPFLVPQVDADGNEVAGVRTPESLVPLATYTR
ncbi:MAG: alpha/beta hydrolase domain-containing protein [Vicinamibacterales bacterium]